jgi:hypothetical protein
VFLLSITHYVDRAGGGVLRSGTVQLENECADEVGMLVKHG